MVKNWEGCNQIYFGTDTFLCDVYQNDFNSNSPKFWSFCFIQFLDIEILSSKICSLSMYGMHHIIYSCHNKISPKSLGDLIWFQS